MFYLKNYFSLIFKYPIRGTLFLGTHLLLFAVFCYGPEIKKSFWSYIGDPNNYPYFYVLYHSESDPDYVRGKIMQVPGILEVEAPDQKKMWEKAQKNLQMLDVPSEYLPQDLKALRVSVVPTFSIESLKLMREYLSKVVGDEELSVTSIHKRDDPKEKRQKEFMLFLKKWGDSSLVSILLLCWAFAFYMFRSPLREISQILEYYQRRSKVELKILMSGWPIYNLVLLWAIFNVTLPFLPGLIAVNLCYLLLVIFASKWRYV